MLVLVLFDGWHETASQARRDRTGDHAEPSPEEFAFAELVGPGLQARLQD